jgi:hypothetical protein
LPFIGVECMQYLIPGSLVRANRLLSQKCGDGEAAGRRCSSTRISEDQLHVVTEYNADEGRFMAVQRTGDEEWPTECECEADGFTPPVCFLLPPPSQTKKVKIVTIVMPMSITGL